MTRPTGSRRGFLRATGALLASGAAEALWPQLGLIPAALAQSAPGYKALVCLYLGGGNDSWNLLMPGGGSAWEVYRQTRNGVYSTQNTSGLALPASDGSGFVAGQTPPPAIAVSGGYGVNPFCTELAQLYEEGHLAFLANIGTLIEPITRATYTTRRRPPQLFAHNEQTALWQIGTADNAKAPHGWGGMVAGRTALPTAQTAGLPPTITLSGHSRFLAGNTPSGLPLFSFALSTSNTSPAASLSEYGLPGRSANQFQQGRLEALAALLDLASPQPFTDEYRRILARSIELATEVVNPAFASIAPSDPVNLPFEGLDGSSLYSQLRQIARMIKVSADPGLARPILANRQVFFVSLGGWDTHSGQITSPGATAHHARLQTVSRAVNAFFRSMQAIGMADKVTLFTASEFARTLNSNGDGTDHAWGGVQFVVGGAVNGRNVYGRYPSLALNNSLGAPVPGTDPSRGETLSRGQFLPTLAVDQLGATLARWMGVSDGDLLTLFPNLDNFRTGPVGNPSASPTFAYFSRTIPGLMQGV